MTELSVLLDIISDRQLREYVAWLDAHPDSDEEDSIDYLMEIMTDSQIDMLLEMEEFNATPYSNWFGACLLPDGRCMETTMSDCRVLGGRFQGPGTSCGGHYTKPVMYQSEEGYDDSYYDPQMATEQAYENWSEDWVNGASEDVLKIYIALTGDEDTRERVAYRWYDNLSEEEREDILADTDNLQLNQAIDDIMDNLLSSWDDQFLAEAEYSVDKLSKMSFKEIDRKSGFLGDRLANLGVMDSWTELSKSKRKEILNKIKKKESWLDWERFTAPVGKVYHDPAAARDPRLKNDNPPSSVTQYLRKHPEVANLYDDDDASVMLKGIIIGCLIGALGTIFGNLASEMIMDKFKINPQFKWDR